MWFSMAWLKFAQTPVQSAMHQQINVKLTEREVGDARKALVSFYNLKCWVEEHHNLQFHDVEIKWKIKPDTCIGTIVEELHNLQ
jgi:hypothetical protein